MKKIILLFLIPILLYSQSDAEKATITKIGQIAPSFSAKTIDGKSYELDELKGKVVLINFFATWCPPCQKELPHLQEDIYKKHKNDDFVLMVIGREHNANELNEYKTKKNLNLPFVPDPQREIYGKYAKNTIPRNVLIDKNGKIVAQYIGFKESDFIELKSKIKDLLK